MEQEVLKIKKISKYKREKNFYRAITILASMVSGVSVLISSYILYEGIKGNGEYGPAVTIFAGLLGLFDSIVLALELNKEEKNIDSEYQKSILKLQSEIEDEKVMK